MEEPGNFNFVFQSISFTCSVQVNEMDWNTKLKYLKRNLVTVERQIDSD